MKKIFNKALLATSLAMVIAPVAYATNGLAPTGLGQVHKAMGGAAVGNPENTMSLATNPASASFVDDGYDVELELFKPNRTVIRKELPATMGGALLVLPIKETRSQSSLYRVVLIKEVSIISMLLVYQSMEMVV